MCSFASGLVKGKTILPYLAQLNNEFRIILASGSPRRRELLTQMGLTNFEIILSKFEEDLDKASYTPVMYCAATSFGKLKAVMAVLQAPVDKGLLVISADTIIEIDGKVLEKPIDKQDAIKMLTMLSGKTHAVHTAVSIAYQTKGMQASEVAFQESTKCTFIDLSEDDILAYVSTGEGADKSGSYGIQGIGGQLVDKIDGCYYNVMGLPINALSRKIALLLNKQ
jgi:septum formation protein